MTIPKTHELYSKVLEVTNIEIPTSLSDVRKKVLEKVSLTDSELSQKTKGGGNQILSNINWAISHLAQAEALQRPEKGFVSITELGKITKIHQPSH